MRLDQGRIALCGVICGLFLPGTASSAEIRESARLASAREYVGYIKHLSSDKFRGRATGTTELDEAAQYIARQFQKANLQPLGGSFFQPFPVSTNSKLGDHNSMQMRIREGRANLRLGEDFTPLAFSGAGTIRGGMAFAGYGITAPEYKYDDYAGVDVRGKIVIVLTHEPNEFHGKSVFEGRIYTEHAQLQTKALNAKDHGAVGMILANDIENHAPPDKLEIFLPTSGPADPGIPVLQVKASLLGKWFEAAGTDFSQTQAKIDREEKPASFLFPPDFEAEIVSSVEHKTRPATNVVGFLPGRTENVVVIGAHYDHLGLGEQFSLAPEKAGFVHPGADDNASGTAGLIILAKLLGSGPKPENGILFVAFAGEELGLLGSSFYVKHPLLPLERTRLMINMDMIGRISNGKLAVGGATADSPYRGKLQDLEGKHQLHLELEQSAVYGSSDHTVFRTKLIPFLFFFAGLHDDYHRPSDTWDKIEAKGALQLFDLIAELVAQKLPVEPKATLTGAAARY